LKPVSFRPAPGGIGWSCSLGGDAKRQHGRHSENENQASNVYIKDRSQPFSLRQSRP
jgi:hypothetical protein